MTAELRHEVRVVCEGYEVSKLTSYDISTNILTPAAGFTLVRAFDQRAWELLRKDALVQVYIDGAPILKGLIDGRRKSARDGTMTIRGRDLVGRLTQESAPRINYEGMELTQAIDELAFPWFDKVTMTDARNRKLRMGKARNRVPAGTEPLIVKRSANGAGRAQPGTMRWAIIQELCSQAQLVCWASADGRELFVGKPNGKQSITFLFRKSASPGGVTNVKELILDEDIGDMYSVYSCVGTGGGTEVDFGIAVSSRRSTVYDNPDNQVDGTGLNFLRPKRLLLPERNYDSNDDADRVAERERVRRSFKVHTQTAEVQYHGQWFGSQCALFAPNTIANVVDEDFKPFYDRNHLIYGCAYRRSANDGETTTIEMVPAETEFVQ